MRTLISIRDVQDEVNRGIACPRCKTGEILQTTTCHLEITPKGTINVQRGAVCDEHGYFTFTRPIKAVQMHGKDAQIIPKYDHK
jgi:hypothetical protein